MSAIVITHPAFSKTITRYHVFYNKLNNLIVGVSAKLYYLDNGKLPGKIDALVFQYFKSVPGDTFNDFKPLAFNTKSNGFIVYSFGPNKKDDKGEIIFNTDEYFQSNQDRGDIVLSVTIE